MRGCADCAGGDKTLAECFNLFALIHQLTTEHDTITRITREVSVGMCVLSSATIIVCIGAVVFGPTNHAR